MRHCGRGCGPTIYLRPAIIALLGLAALLATTGGAFHQPVHDLATDPADLTVKGVKTVDQLGWIVASGDFNGDGNADLLVTARLADPGGAGNEGAAYVIFGPRSGTIDLALCPGDPNHCADVVIKGADGSDQLGFSAAAADFNGDSYDDILVASYQADGPGTGTCVNQNDAFRGTGDRCSSGEAYMIRNGEIQEAVRPVMLTGNLFETLENLDGIGNDLAMNQGGGCGKGGQMPLPVSNGSPHIRIRKCLISGA